MDAGIRSEIASGDRLRSLVAIRDRLAGDVEAANAREVPALVKELRAVLAEIDELAPAKEGGKLDELAARRARRVADTEGKPDSTGKRGRRSGGSGARRSGGAKSG